MQAEKFNPELLLIARNSLGLSQSELSKRIGVGQNTLSRWESGLRAPGESEIDNLAQELGRDASFFFRTERPLAVDAAFMFHRKKASTKQTQLRKLHARINVTRLALVPLLKQLSSWDVRVHRIPIDEAKSAEDAALKTRAAWNVAKGPIRNLVELLESAGVIVVPFDFGMNSVDAIGWWPWDTPPLMFLNTSAPADRQRFSLAHELGHLVMHELPSETMEDEANQFAAEFLFPVRSAKTETRELNSKMIWRLKRRWRVAGQCVLRRSFDAKNIDKKRYTSLMVYFSKNGWRKNEPYPVEREHATTLSRVLDAFRNDLGYSREELRKVMGVTIEELATVFGFLEEPPELRIFSDQISQTKPR